MALNASKSLIAAVVVCGVIAAVYLPPRGTIDGGMPRLSAAEVRLRVAEGSLRKAVEVHGVEQRRDSIRSMAAAAPGDSLLALGVGLDTALRRMVAQEWSETGAIHPLVRPVAAYLADSAPTYAGLTMPPPGVTLLPEAMGAPVCAALLGRAPRTGFHRTERFWRLELRRGLGPCAFEAVYGVPGPQIASWLAARNYDLASTTLLSASGAHIPPGDDRFAAELGLLRLVGAERADARLSLDAVACLRGSAERCAAAVLSPRLVESALPLRGTAMTMPSMLHPEFGGAEVNYLADLAREIGPERFAQFWRSEGDVESAFKAAAGRPIGEWTLAWARRRVGDDAGGVPLRAGVAVESLVFAALMSVLAAAVVRKWRVV